MLDVGIEELERVCGGQGVVPPAGIPAQEWMNLLMQPSNAKAVSEMFAKYGAALTKGKIPPAVINAGTRVPALVAKIKR